jgi:hypothetical protein
MKRPLVYRRYGGSLQVFIPSFDFLLEAIRIPETQWFATACPVVGLHCDPRFLAFVDTDKNGRIRVAEVRAAVEHTARLLTSYKGADEGSDVLELEGLAASEEGAKLRSTALLLLETLKAEDRTRISLEQVRAADKALNTDLTQKDTLEAMGELERLILYQRWLLTLANNFISMPDLYVPKRRALVERGTLILGGRRYQLSVLVTHHDSHFALNSQGTTCTLYVKVEPKEGTEGYEVAIPVTRGRSTELGVGKRGVFYDIEGKEYDATVTQLIRHPVSLWEAMTMPLERIGRFITSKIEALSTAGEKSLDEQLEQSYKQSSAVAVVPGAPLPPGAPPPPQQAGIAGYVAAGGIALAAVGSSLAFIVTQVKTLTLFDILSAAIILLTVVMAPAGLLGWLKLRQRNLALLLEGAGWALNDRLMLTPELALLVTRKPKLPAHAKVDRTDMMRSLVTGAHADDEREGLPLRGRLGLLLLLVFILGWQFREPLRRESCSRGWLSTSLCAPVPRPPPGEPAQP